MRGPLTACQAEWLAALERLTAELGRPPSMQELADHRGRRLGAATSVLETLRHKGYVGWRPRLKRTLRARLALPQRLLTAGGAEFQLVWQAEADDLG